MTDMKELEDLLDLCMARTEGVLSKEHWEQLAALKGSARMRRGFVGEILAVALAGATGSGKSSLVNAMCGQDVAAVGVRRPTTSRSLAVVPREISADLSLFVDRLNVDDTIVVESLDDVVFVDLPDMDSTVREHRTAVEAALRVVDAVVWVLDPEKYADVVIHEEFLAPLSQYADQFVFCLNKADRIGPDVAGVTTSLKEHLIRDGYLDPEIVSTTATSEGGSDMAIESLMRSLDARLDHKRTAQMKVALDVRRLASDSWARLNANFEDLAGDERETAAVAMASFVSLGVAAFALHHDLAEPAGS